MQKYKSREEAIKDHEKNYRSAGFRKGKFDEDSPDSHRISKIICHVGEGTKVLDIGCNDGSMCTLLQPRGCSLFGVDVVPELIEIATGRGILAFKASAEELPFPKNFFDVVIMAEVLEHLFNPLEGLEEVRRVLRPGGIFVGSVPHHEGGMGAGHHADYHQNVFTTIELTELLQKFFVQVDIKPTPYSKHFCKENTIPEDMFQWNNFYCQKNDGTFVTKEKIDNAVKYLKKHQIHEFYFCPKGYWLSDPDIGMKNECPNCKAPLNYLKGLEEEIKDHVLNEKENKGMGENGN